MRSAVGYSVGALLAPRFNTERAPGIVIPLAWAAGGAPLILLGLFNSDLVAIGAMVAEGALGAVGNVTFLSVVQKSVPEELLGRYFATDEAMSYAMIPAGLVVGDLLIVAIGIAPAFLVAGVASVGVGGVVILNSRLRQWGRKARPDPPSPTGTS